MKRSASAEGSAVLRLLRYTEANVCRGFVAAALLASFTALGLPAQQTGRAGGIAGLVVNEEGRPVAEVTISVTRADGGSSQNALSDARGLFRISALPPGLYSVSARRLGFRGATLPSFRVTAGQTADIRVMLTASPTQLSTVQVRVTPTSIDATTAELTRRIEVADVALVPMGRDAASLVELVPGASRGFVWGGAGDAANNYQLDGVSVNHPGTGGDFLAPSIDWIEALEVRGLGAGAEHGGFQGGIINAVTKTGTNNWQAALRTQYISPSLTSSNTRPNEEGTEQSMRRELSADMRGPLVRDRLFYFLGGVVVDRRVEIPDLRTVIPDDVRSSNQEYRDIRAIGKLTFRPGPLDRLDALVGHTDSRIDRADLNGIDDAAASQRVASPTTFYELGWLRSGVTSSLDARLVGFNSRETRLSYAGDDVPGVRVFTTGRQPQFQNSAFSDRVKPQSIGGNLVWKNEHQLFGGPNRIVIGGEYTRGAWEKNRTRNGGLTWYPYVNPATRTVNPYDATTWVDAASEWGGEIRIDADVEDAAIFVQDYLEIRPGITITPGLRFGRWRGWLTPADDPKGKFLAVTDNAIAPRIGLIWDVTGRNDLVVKAHWGHYHQSMSALFFDRAEGAGAYTNERFYLQGPDVTDSRTVFTPQERDARLDQFTGFSPLFAEAILNEAGRVENYRQPYVQQAILAVEKRFGQRWKVEMSYTNRVNKDIVGLVDRNIDQNYSPLVNVHVRDRIAQTPIHDHHGNPLIIPVIWISNYDLRQGLIRRRDALGRPLPPVPGYTFADIDRLTFDPDVVLTTVPGARRAMHQISASVRTDYARWSWFGSATYTNLKGNVGGLTGFGTSADDFTAGPGVRLNEKINFEGVLPNVPVFQAKSWVSGQLIYGIRGGVLANFTVGEYFEPNFRITPRFRLQTADRMFLEDSLFAGVLGQTLLIEKRGTRNYPPRFTADFRLEKQFNARGLSYVLSGDVFNAFGSDAIVLRNLTVNDGVSTDPTSIFGAPRRRVSPLRLQIGFRLERDRH